MLNFMPADFSDSHKVQVMAGAVVTILCLQLAKFFLLPRLPFSSLLPSFGSGAISPPSSEESPECDSGSSTSAPSTAQSAQKQMMLKDTAKRVNAWGQKLRMGIQLTKVEVYV